MELFDYLYGAKLNTSHFLLRRQKSSNNKGEKTIWATQTHPNWTWTRCSEWEYSFWSTHVTRCVIHGNVWSRVNVINGLKWTKELTWVKPDPEYAVSSTVLYKFIKAIWRFLRWRLQCNCHKSLCKELTLHQQNSIKKIHMQAVLECCKIGMGSVQ